MKKFLYLFAGAAFLFSACSDDDNAGNGGDNGSEDIRNIFVETKDISNLPSSTTIDEVGFYVYYNSEASKHELVSDRWQNGFTFKLPETVSASYLSDVKSLIRIDEDDAEINDVKISNTSAKVTQHTEFIAFNDDKEVGELYVSGNDGDWVVWYLYSDRDVTVKGNRQVDDEKDIYDLDLKKGWNRVAYTNYNETSDAVDYSIYHLKTDLPSKLHWRFR